MKYYTLRYVLKTMLLIAAYSNVIASEMEHEQWLEANKSKIQSIFAENALDIRLNDYSTQSINSTNVGRKIFFDKRISKNGDKSCASCHQPNRLWTDGLQKPINGMFNTPTLIGANRLKWLFWDGRVIGLANQAIHPMKNINELGIDSRKLLYLMANEQEYNTAYRRQFGKLPDIECISNNEDLCENQLKVFQKNTGKLVASFVASIPIPHTKFDTFLMDLQKGAKQSTFTTQNISGLRLFVEKGNCAACHNGNNLTDGQFHNVLVSETIGPGVFMPGRYLGLQTAKSSSDTEYLGLDAFETFARAEISRARFDSSLYGAFKTPTLRGLSCTSPYMHNGKFSTLKDVLKHYSSFEDVISPEHHDDPLTKPRNFNEFEIKDLLSFLLTLSPTEDACDMKY